MTCGRRDAAAAGFALAVLAGCSSTSSSAVSGARGAGCVERLTFDGTTYQAWSLKAKPPFNKLGLIPKSHQDPVGSGLIPTCVEGNTNTPNNTSVRVARIRGFEVSVVVVNSATGVAYIREGAKPPSRLANAKWIHWVTP
jgi:hypothetical protein